MAVAAPSKGVVWFTDLWNNSIGRMTPSGVASHFDDPHVFTSPLQTIYQHYNSSNAIGGIPPLCIADVDTKTYE